MRGICDVCITGNLKKCDIANGIGVRVTLFVSGCTQPLPGLLPAPDMGL